MGRTYRIRKKRRLASPDSTAYRIGKSSGEIDGFTSLSVWMSKEGWKPTCKIVPAMFPDTGRGFVARKNIECDDVIVKIPGHLLITVKTVSGSKIGRLFNDKKPFSAQQVISAFLMWQKHEGEKAFWCSYITSLPSSSSSPVNLHEEELQLLPEFLARPIRAAKENILDLHLDLINSLDDSDVCDNCNVPFTEIFSLDNFMWAWSMVNSRAVYISPERHSEHLINLSDENTLAMAPYLDMFNHSCNAKVQAYIDAKDDSYQIRTCNSYLKNQQVFINYGSHSNLKLFLEYGFIIPNNHNDGIPISYDNIISGVTKYFPCFKMYSDVLNKRYKFLKSHEMLNNLNVHADGLSWNTKVAIYILTSAEDVSPRAMQQKVFSGCFEDRDLEIISNVGLYIVANKIVEYQKTLQSFNDRVGKRFTDNACLKMARDLLQEYLNVLDNSRASFNL
ncbi:SET domain-containing protein 4 [Nilaparvata lugens]|uniref:SET domain-containing protein 4 n=1 Tax=Nilaparvata lugens TaxID=108931 RepID=UPI00193D2690|nr:SET domain-containing protein 4 [Nilaparvata lugens]XP_039293721.1 SET domain-containing protein 4 [Nilaparvata lugens]